MSQPEKSEKESTTILCTLIYLFREMISEGGLDTEEAEKIRAEEFAQWLTSTGRRLLEAAFEAVGMPDGEDRDTVIQLVHSPFFIGWLLRSLWPAIRCSSRKKAKHTPTVIIVTVDLVFPEEPVEQNGILVAHPATARQIQQTIEVNEYPLEGACYSMLMHSVEMVGKLIVREGFDKIHGG